MFIVKTRKEKKISKNEGECENWVMRVMIIDC